MVKAPNFSMDFKAGKNVGGTGEKLYKIKVHNKEFVQTYIRDNIKHLYFMKILYHNKSLAGEKNGSDRWSGFLGQAAGIYKREAALG